MDSSLYYFIPMAVTLLILSCQFYESVVPKISEALLNGGNGLELVSFRTVFARLNVKGAEKVQ